MAQDYKEWKKTLSTFLENVEKDVEEIRRSKAEMQQMKREMVDLYSKGQYMRDDERIVISAPEIVIGNVNKDGTLKTNCQSEIIIRSNTIREEGVGDGKGMFGTVITKAANIQNVCADPGIDGREAVVASDSSFIVQAQGIMLRSEDTEGVFAQPVFTSPGSILLAADRSVSVDAMVPGEQFCETLDGIIKKKKETIENLKTAAKDGKESADKLFDVLEAYSNAGTDFYDTDDHVRTNYVDLDNLHEAIVDLSDRLCLSLNSCTETISALAELNRQVKCLEAKKKKIGEYKANYKTESTGATVDIRAEHTSIVSVDADSNLRENAGAGLSVQAHSVDIHSNAADGSTMKDSAISLSTQNILFTTANRKIANGSSETLAEGTIKVVSKDIQLEAVDYEYKDKADVEKALTTGGSIKMRAETMQVGCNDTEGNAAGSFSVNSKSIKLAAMDVDKESRADKQLAKDSTMLLLADKMYIGSKDKTNQSASVQVSSDKVGVFAKTTAEIQQNEGKATVQLDGGNVAMGGSKVGIYGETAVNGKAAFKGDVEIPKATIDNLEAKTSLKSPHISDGFAVPGAGASGSLSAKLTEEELKGEETK